MQEISRRGMFGLLPGIGAAVVAASVLPVAAAAPVEAAAPAAAPVTTFNWARMELFRRGVIAEVGEDAFESWFKAVELESLQNGKLTVSVPVPFMKRWIDAHYDQALLRGAQRADAFVDRVEIVVREPAT